MVKDKVGGPSETAPGHFLSGLKKMQFVVGIGPDVEHA
jgi:hypothetical protein